MFLYLEAMVLNLDPVCCRVYATSFLPQNYRVLWGLHEAGDNVIVSERDYSLCQCVETSTWWCIQRNEVAREVQLMTQQPSEGEEQHWLLFWGHLQIPLGHIFFIKKALPEALSFFKKTTAVFYHLHENTPFFKNYLYIYFYSLALYFIKYLRSFMAPRFAPTPTENQSKPLAEGWGRGDLCVISFPPTESLLQPLRE